MEVEYMGELLGVTVKVLETVGVAESVNWREYVSLRERVTVLEPTAEGVNVSEPDCNTDPEAVTD